MKNLFPLFALLLAPFIWSCAAENEEYTKQIAELQTQLAAMQEQMETVQQSSNDVAKTELDATGIAIVDMEKLLKDYLGYQAADKRYKAIISGYATELQKLQKQFEERYAMIEKDAASFGEEFVKDDVMELQKFREEIYKKDQELTQKSGQKEAEMLKEVLEKINLHSKKYAEENGYKMILFTSVENGIFYANDEINITEEYITNINNAYSAKN